jgi:hypothetical protein
MGPAKLIERAATTTAHALRHPIASTAYAAGIVRGVAGAGVRALSGHSDVDAPRRERVESTPRPRVAPQRPAPAAEPVADQAAERADVPPPAPTPLHEPFAHEPTATSRDSAHGRGGADADIDAWAEDATDLDDEIDVETPVGTTGADVGSNPDTAEADLQQPGTEPLLDPGTAKAIRSEAETMQKAAEPDKG